MADSRLEKVTPGNREEAARPEQPAGTHPGCCDGMLKWLKTDRIEDLLGGLGFVVYSCCHDFTLPSPPQVGHYRFVARGGIRGHSCHGSVGNYLDASLQFYL